MSVIINDFEVVVEPPAESEAAERSRAQPEGAPAAPPIGPRDVRDMLRRQARREARVRAH